MVDASGTAAGGGSPLVTSPIPDSTGYAQADVLAMNAYNNALARINQQRLSTLQQYGYNGSIDPTSGTISGVSVNPNDPYGNYQMMLRGAAQQSMGDQYANQERGLYGGLANQAISADKFAFGGQSSQLGSALADALSGLQDQQDSAGYARDSALWQAEQTAAQQAISNGNFDTPDLSGVAVPPYGATDTMPQTKSPPIPGAGKRGVQPSASGIDATVAGLTRAQKVIKQVVARRKGARR